MRTLSLMTFLIDENFPRSSAEVLSRTSRSQLIIWPLPFAIRHTVADSVVFRSSNARII